MVSLSFKHSRTMLPCKRSSSSSNVEMNILKKIMNLSLSFLSSSKRMANAQANAETASFSWFRGVDPINFTEFPFSKIQEIKSPCTAFPIHCSERNWSCEVGYKRSAHESESLILSGCAHLLCDSVPRQNWTRFRFSSLRRQNCLV